MSAADYNGGPRPAHAAVQEDSWNPKVAVRFLDMWLSNGELADAQSSNWTLYANELWRRNQY